VRVWVGVWVRVCVCVCVWVCGMREGGGCSELNNVLTSGASDEFRSTVMMLKIMEVCARTRGGGSLSSTYMHTYTRARAHERTHTHTHAHTQVITHAYTLFLFLSFSLSLKVICRRALFEQQVCLIENYILYIDVCIYKYKVP